jgi:hypothetical protein
MLYLDNCLLAIYRLDHCLLAIYIHGLLEFVRCVYWLDSARARPPRFRGRGVSQSTNDDGMLPAVVVGATFEGGASTDDAGVLPVAALEGGASTEDDVAAKSGRAFPPRFRLSGSLEKKSVFSEARSAAGAVLTGAGAGGVAAKSGRALPPRFRFSGSSEKMSIVSSFPLAALWPRIFSARGAAAVGIGSGVTWRAFRLEGIRPLSLLPGFVTRQAGSALSSDTLCFSTPMR